MTDMLHGYAGAPGWQATQDWINAQPVEPGIEARFQAAVRLRPDLLREFDVCAQAYKGLEGIHMG